MELRLYKSFVKEILGEYDNMQDKAKPQTKQLLEQFIPNNHFDVPESNSERYLIQRTEGSTQQSFLRLSILSDTGQLNSDKCVINPESHLRLGWDITILFFILLQAAIVPYSIAFEMQNYEFWIFIDLLMDVSFLLDIIINFDTGYHFKGKLIMKRGKIVKNYLKTWFLMDLISSFPYNWIFEDHPLESSSPQSDRSLYRAPQLMRILKVMKIARMLKLLRIAKLKKILLRFEEIISSEKIALWYLIMRMSLVVFYISHWSACGWYLTTSIESLDNDSTWQILYLDELQEKFTPFEIYVNCMYWSITTMITVGYGDISAQNPSEMFYAINIMMICCGMFAYLIGNISNLLTEANKRFSEHSEAIVSANNWMKKFNINYQLRYKIRKSIDYYYEQYGENKLPEKSILELLNEPLKEEILRFLQGGIYGKFKIFTNLTISKFTVRRLLKLIEQKSYTPGDIVFEEGQIQRIIYFIYKGDVAVYQKQTRSFLRSLHYLDHFGEICFFSGNPRTASIQTQKFTELLIVKYEILKEIAEKNPQDTKVLANVQNLCQTQHYSILNVQCWLCQQIGHVATGCNYYIVNRDRKQFKATWLERRNNSKPVSLISAQPYLRVRQNIKPIRRQINLEKIQKSIDRYSSSRQMISRSEGTTRRPSYQVVISSSSSES